MCVYVLYVADCPIIQVPGRVYPVTVHHLEDLLPEMRCVFLRTHTHTHTHTHIHTYIHTHTHTHCRSTIVLIDNRHIQEYAVWKLVKVIAPVVMKFMYE